MSKLRHPSSTRRPGSAASDRVLSATETESYRLRSRKLAVRRRRSVLFAVLALLVAVGVKKAKGYATLSN